MKKSFIVAALSFTSFFVLTSIVSAQNASNGAITAAQGINTLAGLISAFTSTIVKALATMFLALGVVAFFYGIVEYIWGLREGKPDKITNGNKFMGYGLLALFVMFSVYGIIKFGQGILFQNSDVSSIVIPEFKFGGPGNPTGVRPINSGGTMLNQPLGGDVIRNSGGTMLNEPTGGSMGGSNYDSRRTSQPDYPCTRSNGGSCRSGGVNGSCVGWTCDTSSSEGSDGATYNTVPDGTSCSTINSNKECGGGRMYCYGDYKCHYEPTAPGAACKTPGSTSECVEGMICSNTLTCQGQACEYYADGTQRCIGDPAPSDPTPDNNPTGDPYQGGDNTSNSCNDIVSENSCVQQTGCSWLEDEGICN